jgi:glycerol uptake facilitator-like aquaporin
VSTSQLRPLAAEAIGTFALVFAGAGAIMVDAKTHALGHVGVAHAMFGGPISGASMNPMRSAGPAIVSGDLHALWLYIVAPLLGASIGGVAYQFVRGEPIDAAPLHGEASTDGRFEEPAAKEEFV